MSYSAALPNAAGGTARPTTPASAMMVSGNHLDELRRDKLISLKLDLKRFSGSEQETCKRGANWIPSSEYHCRNCNETASCGHLVRKLMLIQREKYSTERGENSGYRHRNVLNQRCLDTKTAGSGRMLTNCADSQTKRCAIYEEREHRRNEQSHP
jgi:hypothetical protein